MRLCINAAALLLSTGLVAASSLDAQKLMAATLFAPGSESPTVGTNKSIAAFDKPQLSSRLLSSDKALPEDELLDITNLQPIPGVPLLSPQSFEDDRDLHQPISSFNLPYTLDNGIGISIDASQEALLDDSLPSPDVAVGSDIETPADLLSPASDLGSAIDLQSDLEESDTEVPVAEEPAANEPLQADGVPHDGDMATDDDDNVRTVPYILKPDDSVESLANKFALSQQAILDANDESLADVKEGDVIELPWVPTVLGHEDFSTGNHQALQLARLDLLPVEDTMMWPVGGRLTSGYGWRSGRMHAGIDIVGPVGTPIVAALSGRVIFSGWYYGYGYMVDIEHANGTVTRYAHASRLYVSVGQQVKQGQPIMALGSTGRSTGPHLHFEVRQNGYPLNPLAVLNGSSPSQNLATTTY